MADAPASALPNERDVNVEGFDPRTSFGYEVSKRYDAGPRGDERETVAFLARQAKGRDALEFAVGTGRIALPLTKAGVRVDGIELSQDMVDRMREKPGGAAVDVVIGDMSRAGTGRSYGLVYLVYNTIGNLLTQDDQIRCFQNAARYDPVTQILDLNHVCISADGIFLSPISLRLAHPPEFDLMARIAGLRLQERWGGWNCEPYTASSWRHISVYEPGRDR